MPTTSKMRAILRRLVYQQKGLCTYCELPFGADGGFRRATLDHVISRSQGGSNRQDNLVAACYPCNQEKGRQDGATFRAVLKDRRFQAETLAQQLRRSVQAIGEP